MTDTFAWRRYVAEPSCETNFQVSEAQFGDGYAQAAAAGLNNVQDTWAFDIEGHRTDDQLAAIEAFLRAHGGATSFLWTPPNGVQGLYRCQTLKRTDLGDGWQRLSVSFKQTFQP